MPDKSELENLLKYTRILHEKIRDAVVRACDKTAIADLSQIAKEEEGDTIYAIDRVSEELIVEYLTTTIAKETPIVLIAEGLERGKITLPAGADEKDAKWRIIVDPIDGTRGIMYQKRSAWILTGIAPNKGEETSLQDIELAVQTEIPLVKQHLSDTLWAIRGRGSQAERFNRMTGERTPLFLKPSGANTIAHGYAQISRFFPGAREELAAIDEEIVRGALGDVQKGKTHCFEDQYTSTGGQIYELIAGHDRFTADLRPLMERKLNERGLFLGICCHPYDICTELIARESGVIITDASGDTLDAKLDVETDVDWVGYANPLIQKQIEPLFAGEFEKARFAVKMFSIVSEKAEELPDVAEFVEKLNGFQQKTNFFDPAHEIYVSRAPGRLDLMGGIADYSGSLVLQYPIREATFTAIQKDFAHTIKIISLLSETGESRSFELSLKEIKAADYKTLRELFQTNAENHWAAYIIGVFAVLACELGIKFVEGARIFISSNVPEGKGVSSSAALEVSVMQAVNAAFDLKINSRELALLCQKAENEIVGAPCGVMDQMVSSCGEANKLLALVCQPAELKGTISLPDEIEIWGIDSGIRHSVAGADYGSVRAGAFIGYRIIADIAGLKVENLENNLVKIADEKWRGFLANISPEEFEKEFKLKLPEKIVGTEFLKKYHGTTDKITEIKPEKEYAVLNPTAHPIYENFRVERFAQILGKSLNQLKLQELGELMFQSHASYSACDLGADGTDLLVESVKEIGAENGLFGAKITGGGSGGTVAVLGRKGAFESVENIAETYEKEPVENLKSFRIHQPAQEFSVLEF